jgi:aspartyl-tRNA synthetase
MRILSSEVKPGMDGKEVNLAGWVHEKRDLGGVKFIVLRDRGGFIQITGVKKKTDTKVLELPLPMDPTWKTPAELDTRLDNRLLDVRRPEIQAIFEIRAVILEAAREFMRGQNFVEMSFPSVVKAGAEGGALLFPLSYFDQEAFLSQSAQLYKQYLACTNFERVFSVGQSWRAEPSHTTRHLSEFWQLDYEMAFIEDEDDVMNVTEGVFEYIIRTVVKRCQKQLKILGAKPVVPKLPFPRVEFKQVLEMLKKEGIDIRDGEDIPDYGEKKLGEIMLKKGHAAYFITKYPRKVRAFYIMMDGPVSRGFDLDFMGLEMCSGGQREHRIDVLKKMLKEKGYDVSAFDFYLNIFKYGAPPHGGVGIGIERILTSLLGLSNIREAILFPRDTKRLIP